MGFARIDILLHNNLIIRLKFVRQLYLLHLFIHFPTLFNYLRFTHIINFYLSLFDTHIIIFTVQAFFLHSKYKYRASLIYIIFLVAQSNIDHVLHFRILKIIMSGTFNTSTEITVVLRSRN